MKVVIDMCLSTRWAPYLSDHGHDAVHWSSVGQQDDPDEVILTWAVSEGAVILTKDLDFGMLVFSRRQTGPSIIQIRSDADLPEDTGTQILRALTFLTHELGRRALITVAAGRSRVTLLSFREDDDGDEWEPIPDDAS